MFMRVNSRCAHQVRPPGGDGAVLGRITLGDYSGPVAEGAANSQSNPDDPRPFESQSPSQTKSPVFSIISGTG